MIKSHKYYTIIFYKIKHLNKNNIYYIGDNMIIHIVRPNEKVDSIMNHYMISKNELISNNGHINDWNNLIPGVKIRIPEITKEILEVLDESEPFVEEYYPKQEEKEKKIINDDDSNKNIYKDHNEDIKSEEKNDDQIDKKMVIDRSKITFPGYYYYPRRKY